MLAIHPRHIMAGQAGLAVACLTLALATAFWPDWLESLTGWDPDGHSGEVEWLLVACLAAVGAISAALAGASWMRWRQLAR
jgi:ABC-type cobalt transport system substrate-binding protein